MGILNAFIGINNSKATGLAAVAGGIAEALVTTAIGLLVAIPAVMMFNYLTGRVEAFDLEMDKSSTELIDYFLKQDVALAVSGLGTVTRLGSREGERSRETAVRLPETFPEKQRTEPPTAVADSQADRGSQDDERDWSGSFSLPIESSVGPVIENQPGSGKGGAAPPVYPNIAVSSEHPVQGSVIDVTVSLDFEIHGRTIGTAYLPEDEAEYEVDVHLLFETASAWGKLQFQRPQGTTCPAKFEKVSVPVIQTDLRNRVVESRLSEIVVNFYLNNRWCGEALITIEIRARMNTEPLAAIDQKKVMPWREHMCVNPKAAPPDFLVRIQNSNGHFRWTLLSPHMNFSDLAEETLESSVGDLPHRFVKKNFEVFTGSPLTDEQLDDLDTKCDLIYATTAPGFRKAYWRLFRASREPATKTKLESIQFISDEPYIPWELMRVWDKDNAQEAPEVLGVRHAVGRWMADDSCELRQELHINNIAVCATSYRDVPNVQRLPWAEEELKYLENNFRAVPVKMLRESVKNFLDTGRAEVVHFSCHGKMSAQEPEDATLELEDKPIKPGLVARPQTRLGVGTSNPLIFLNACQVGGAGEVLGLVFGWPQAFLKIGSTACVAPLWSVIDANARLIADEFYRLTLTDPTPKTLGQALQAIRKEWRDKRSLTYLGYVLYGDPTARITR